MQQWQDVYFRTNKDDGGMYPTGGCLSSCFDIITRQEPLNDPSSLINDDWDKNDSQDLNARMNNYIYVRGKNLAEKAQTGQVYLYYCPANLLLLPNQWKSQTIKVGGGNDHFDFSVDKGKNFVCSDNKQGCFYWEPQMITNDHYCLISRVVTKDHPADIPSVSNVRDFGKFISENRSYGWRNVSVVDKDTADFSQSVEYNQGDVGSEMHIILSCKDVPVGAEVAFDCPAPGPTPLIHMARTKITESNQDVGIVCKVPANFTGKVTYYYWGNGKLPGDNFSITLHVVMFVTEGDSLYQYTKHYEELGFSLHKGLRDELRIGGSIGPERGIILGQYSSKTGHR